MFWGFLAGLTWGFREKRPWEGWWGAFNRACNVVALFFVALAVLAVGLTFYERYVGEPREEARMAEWYSCIEENYNGYAPSYHPLCYSPWGDGYGCTPEGYLSDWDRRYPMKPCPAE